MSEEEEDAFDLFSLEPRFDLSPDLLEEAYIRLQKNTHPDEFSGKSELMRLAASRQASRVNQAYEQLKNPLLRAALLLKRQGLWPVSPCPAALQEAMELREEALETDNPASFIVKVTTLLEESMYLLSQAFTQSAWPQAAQEYLRLSYLQKLQESC